MLTKIEKSSAIILLIMMRVKSVKIFKVVIKIMITKMTTIIRTTVIIVTMMLTE